MIHGYDPEDEYDMSDEEAAQLREDYDDSVAYIEEMQAAAESSPLAQVRAIATAYPNGRDNLPTYRAFVADDDHPIGERMVEIRQDVYHNIISAGRNQVYGCDGGYYSFEPAVPVPATWLLPLCPYCRHALEIHGDGAIYCEACSVASAPMLWPDEESLSQTVAEVAAADAMLAATGGWQP